MAKKATTDKNSNKNAKKAISEDQLLLEEIDGKTKVTHIFDWSKSWSEKSVQFFIKQNKSNMSNSLNKLEEFLNRIYT